MVNVSRQRPGGLQPQPYRGRPRVMTIDEIKVCDWLHNAGWLAATSRRRHRVVTKAAHHERLFFDFGIQDGIRRGFSPDFTPRRWGSLIAVEVCVADRYSDPSMLPAGTNQRKWRPPAIKMAEKDANLELLAKLYGLPGFVLTGEIIDQLGRLTTAERTFRLEYYARIAITSPALEVVKTA